MAGTKYFSVPAMIVLFRETLEAAIIISVLLQLLNRIHQVRLKRFVWAGAMAGVVLSIIFGVAFTVAFYVAEKKIFEGKNEAIFEGVFYTIASLFIGALAFSMLRAPAWEEKFKRKLSAKIGTVDVGKDFKKAAWAVFLIAFINVIREGIESVVFITGVSAGYPWQSLPIAGLVGLFLGVVCGVLIFYSFSRVALRWFVWVSTIALFFIAAGLFSRAMHEIQEVGAFGCYQDVEEGEEGKEVCSPVKWSNKPLWNTCKCCNDADSGFFEILRALLGYSCDPTFVELMSYISFWLLIMAIAAWRISKGTLTTFKDLDDNDDLSIPQTVDKAAVANNVV